MKGKKQLTVGFCKMNWAASYLLPKHAASISLSLGEIVPHFLSITRVDSWMNLARKVFHSLVALDQLISTFIILMSCIGTETKT